MTPVSRLDAEMLHQPRRVHVSVANADAAIRHCFGNQRGRNIGKVEAKGGNALGDASRIIHPIDDGPGRPQDFKHLARERRFVLAYRSHGANQRSRRDAGLAPPSSTARLLPRASR